MGRETAGEGRGDEVLTCTEAAAYLGLTVQTVWRLLRQAKLAGKKTGPRWLIRRDDLDAYLAGRDRTFAPQGDGGPDGPDSGAAGSDGED